LQAHSSPSHDLAPPGHIDRGEGEQPRCVDYGNAAIFACERQREFRAGEQRRIASLRLHLPDNGEKLARGLCAYAIALQFLGDDGLNNLLIGGDGEIASIPARRIGSR